MNDSFIAIVIVIALFGSGAFIVNYLASKSANRNLCRYNVIAILFFFDSFLGNKNLDYCISANHSSKKIYRLILFKLKLRVSL